MNEYSAEVFFEEKSMSVIIHGDREIIKDNKIFFDYNLKISGSREIACFVVETLVRPLLRGFDSSIVLNNPYATQNIIYYSNKFQGLNNDENYIGNDISEITKEKSCPALFFGGGKDSLLASEIISQIYPDNEKYLVRLHMHGYASGVQAREKKYQDNFYKYIKSKGFSSLEAKTNLFSDIYDKKLTNHLHAGLYPAAFAPLINDLEINQLYFGFDAAEFYGKTFYRRGRPEVLKDLGRSLSFSAGKVIKMRNINFGFTPYVAFKTLVTNSPHVFKEFVNMCETPREKWCHSCRKCFHYMIFSFGCGYWPEDFDVERLLRSDFFIKILNDVDKEKSEGKQYYLSRNIQFSADRHYFPILACMNDIDKNWLSNSFIEKGIDGYGFIKLLSYIHEGIESYSNHGFDFEVFNKYWNSAYFFEKYYSSFVDDEDKEIGVINTFLNNADISSSSEKEINSYVKGREVKYSFFLI